MSVQYNHPNKFPISLNYGLFAKELADAQYSLGLLEGLQRKLQNSALLIAPLTAKEATVSSKIEGTQSTASDVFLFEAGGEPRYRDTAEVSNYRKAMTFAMEELKENSIFSQHFLKSAHSLLLQGVRHRGKVGEFRDGPVWIAEKYGDSIEKAIYIPPEAVLVPEYISNLIEYIKNSDDNTLVMSGMVHYQFEAIHPFEDGNGRIGRLLVPFLLHYRRQLSLPILYLSGYFDERRDAYIKALHEVDKTGRYEPWITFFLKAVSAQASETRELIENICSLYDEIKGRFEITKSPYLIPFLDYTFGHPIFSVPQIIETMKTGRMTAIRLTRLFLNEKILFSVEIKGSQRKFYGFGPLLNLLR
ncbi:MAG: Fic family protein [Patescibacteria group bacterium]|nr:Fic family protein [Patescibacteria group bacterium]